MNKDIGVIFDFNGTCIFDGKYHNMAWKTYIEELSMKPVSDRDTSLWIIGKTPKEILEHFLGYELSDNMINQFSEEKERIYRSLIAKDDVPLAPGLKDFLNYLLLAQVKRTIATTANLENMNMYLIKNFRLAFGNRIMKQVKDFVPCFVACGGTELEAVDFIIAKKVLRKFESLSLGFMKDELTKFSAYLDRTFGKNKMVTCKDYVELLKKNN